MNLAHLCHLVRADSSLEKGWGGGETKHHNSDDKTDFFLEMMAREQIGNVVCRVMQTYSDKDFLVKLDFCMLSYPGRFIDVPLQEPE